MAQEVRRVTLEEALELFARDNLELRIARAEADAAIGEARQSTAYPNLTVTGTHEPLSDGDRSYSESYLNLSQRFVWPGAQSAARTASGYTVDAARGRFAADSARLALDVKRAFIDAAQAERAEEVLARVTLVFREGDGSAKERYAEGDISLYDRQRIHVERIRYETRLADAALEAAAARRRLASLLIPTQDVALAPAGLPTGLPPIVEPAELAETAPARRRDLAAAAASLEAARSVASAARRSRIPDLVATGGYKTQSDGLSGVFLGVSIALPIWDRGSAAVQAAEAEAAAAQARLALTRRQVERDVSDAIQAYGSVVRRVELFGEPSGDDEPDLLDIASTAYREGEMELIELLDAAEALLEADLARIRLRADLWIRYYELERAGGGFGSQMNDGGEE